MGYLECNHIVNLIEKGLEVDDDVRRHLRADKSDLIKEEEIDMNCNKVSGLNSLMERNFSTSYSKSGDVTNEKVDVLK